VTTIPSKMRVLLVDDELIMRKFVADLLRQISVHQIHEASEGKGALVEAIKFQPDLVLSDIHMEPMDGIEFVKKAARVAKPIFCPRPGHSDDRRHNGGNADGGVAVGHQGLHDQTTNA
jgi:CheY-like chemotaxis protein